MVLLGLVFFFLLSVLFVPVCYRAQGKRDENGIWGKAAVSWLFRLVYVRVLYADGKPEFQLYLLGIPLLAVKRKLDRWKAARIGRRKSPDRKKAKKDSVPAETGKLETEKPADSSAYRTEEGSAARLPENSPGRFRRIGEKISEGLRTFKNLIKGILSFPAKLLERIRKLRLTFRGFCDKIKQWYTFLLMEDTRQAVRFLKGKGKLLFRHILPRKMKGKILFGFEDPAWTGQTLAAAAMLCPLYKNQLQITPVFDRAVLEGELKLKGRIFGGYLLWQAWQIYRNREVKITYRRFQHKEA